MAEGRFNNQHSAPFSTFCGVAYLFLRGIPSDERAVSAGNAGGLWRTSEPNSRPSNWRHRDSDRISLDGSCRLWRVRLSSIRSLSWARGFRSPGRLDRQAKARGSDPKAEDNSTEEVGGRLVGLALRLTLRQRLID